MATPVTPSQGGAKLRAIRERAGLTQLLVELESDLGSGYLQRVESGRVALPERSTIERLLAALDARYPDRREVLEAFGYAVATLPPDEAELAWARTEARRELNAFLFPAYVLDCSHRLVAWNRLVARLFGVPSGDPSLGGLAGRSLLAAWFDSGSLVAPLIADPDTFLPAVVRAFRAELDRFRADPWAAALLDGLRRDLPRFRRYWEATAAEPWSASPSRPLAPVDLAVPEVGLLRFRLSAEPFVRDVRFRVVVLLPADPPTIGRCAAWADEPGSAIGGAAPEARERNAD